MNINRNNYEEFFLLYADNELSRTEKKVVEIFVHENPDLKEEFFMICATVNTPDEEIKLTDKSFLIKNESPSFIHENNYEEIFVLYYDNELSLSQKSETEDFIAKNPGYKGEFELIGKARISSDTQIVFPGKKQLYKKEKSGRIIPLILWRSLAAAAFIGFGLWMAILYFNKNEEPQPIATHSHITENPATSGKSTLPDNQTKDNNDIAITTGPVAPEKGKTIAEDVKKTNVKKQKADNSAVAKNNTSTQTSPEKTIIKKPVPDNIDQNNMDQQLVALNNPVEIISPDANNNLLPANTPLKETPPHISHTESFVQNTLKVQHASYLEEPEVKNDNYVFYDVSTNEFNKSKVGGFLKKMKRIVKRNNPIAHLFGGSEEQVAAK
ncbi:MAG: hypothetical protein ABI237_01220 [Ginsengibacter sp.]